jgi:hypothetical protein
MLIMLPFRLSDWVLCGNETGGGLAINGDILDTVLANSSCAMMISCIALIVLESCPLNLMEVVELA